MKRRKEIGFIAMGFASLAGACATAESLGRLGTGGSASSASSAQSSSSSGSGASGGSTGAAGSAQGGGGAGGTAQGGAPPLADLGGHMKPPSCGLACGATELCDEAHLGVDDDCNGQVDEGCACTPGRAVPCFKGDPSKRAAKGCFEGVEICGPDGHWGECQGGAHAVDGCDTTQSPCSDFEMAPYLTADLLTKAVSNFAADAATFQFESLGCSPGIGVCPGVSGDAMPHLFVPHSDGDFAFKYSKQTQGGQTGSCTFNVHVRSAGLRVELHYDQAVLAAMKQTPLTDAIVLHEPGTTNPWTSADHECSYDPASIENCDWGAYQQNTIVDWFSDQAQPPAPTNWTVAPLAADNGCYWGLGINGDALPWRGLAMGCHNPIVERTFAGGICDPTITDGANLAYCGGSVIAEPAPPRATWHRLAFSMAFPRMGGRQPTLRVLCNGRLAALLGPHGYGSPEAPLVLPADASGRWLAADVYVPQDDCGGPCIVEPLYDDAQARTPVVVQDGSFGPAYPPAP